MLTLSSRVTRSTGSTSIECDGSEASSSIDPTRLSRRVFLHHVFGVVDAAEHPESEVDEVRPVLEPDVVDGRVRSYLVAH
jgi:hypothetical protein